MARQRNIPSALLSTGALALLALILLLTAILMQDTVVRFDVTKEKLFTLSDTTRSTLDHLDKTVTIRFYYSRDMAQLPVETRRFAKRVEEMLTEYATRSKGHIRLERINPKPDTDDEDAALVDGLEPQNGSNQGIEGNVYLGASLRCEGRHVPIPVFLPERETMLEYDITSALLSVLREKRRALGVISPLPLFGGPVEGRSAIRPAWRIVGELQKTYDVRQLPLDAEAIPNEVELLLVVHPRNIPQGTLAAIDRFIRRGGKMLAFLDPLCATDLRNSKRNSRYFLPDSASSMSPLLTAWGITFSSDRIVVDEANAATITTSPNSPPHTIPYILNLSSHTLLESDPALVGLSSLYLIESGAFSGTAASGLKLTPLARSSASARFIEPYMTQRNPADILRGAKSEASVKILAIRLDGIFPPAFSKEGQNDSSDSQKSQASGSVVLVGDADMLYDPFCGVQTERNGHSVWQPTNHNIAFTLNLLESLAGDSQLSLIRARSVNTRPFLRIQKIAKEAEKTYLAECEKLNAELQKAKREIYELQQKAPADKKHIVSQEQREAVERYRQKEAETNRNILALRKNMRREITRIENRIILLNIALMPCLVVLAGLCIALARHFNRTRKPCP